MDVDLSSVIWSELKRYISTVDRREAAEALISILVDNDVDVDDIKTAFKGDGDIKYALNSYLDQGHDESEEDEEEEYDDEDYNEDDDWEN